MNKKNLQDKLLKLIEKLDVPILPEEAKAHMAKLKDKDIENLIKIYGEVNEFWTGIDEVAKKTDPKAYKKIDEDYKKEIKKNEHDYKIKLAKIDYLTDKKLDKIDDKYKEALNNLSEKIKRKLLAVGSKRSRIST